jgi:LmbE family N-acetylglucosaminyl deacetylase
VRRNDRVALRLRLHHARRLLPAAAALLAVVVSGPAAAAPPLERVLEPFPPRADYAYELEPTAAAVHVVELDADGFAWPPDLHGDTAFLELELVRARRQPGIRTRRGEIELHQVFEDGARGRRFLDLSPLLRAGAGAGEVALEPERVRFELGPARLFVFDNPTAAALEDLRVLVVAPHPDDAEIAAFGVYSSTDADVVTVTSGDAGDQGFGVLYQDPGEHFRVKGWIRTWDSITVPFFGGVEPGRARNLGYYDATLADLWREQPAAVEPLYATLERPGFYRELNVDPALRARVFGATWPNLVSDLAAELERVRPRVVVAPHPLLDRHRDHQFTTVALLEALATWNGDCELWLYTNHAIENESWPLGPRTATTGLPPWSGGDLFYSRIYSHQLAPEDRRRKLVALEAMHDLRPFDLRDGSAEEGSPRERALARRYDYFRRAPRPNELFFVATRDDAARLRAAFVQKTGIERQKESGSIVSPAIAGER